jgi:hypothetical protein
MSDVSIPLVIKQITFYLPTHRTSNVAYAGASVSICGYSLQLDGLQIREDRYGASYCQLPSHPINKNGEKLFKPTVVLDDRIKKPLLKKVLEEFEKWQSQQSAVSTQQSEVPCEQR